MRMQLCRGDPMRCRSRLIRPLLALIAILIFAASTFAVDAKETILYAFQGGSDGADPNSGLVADAQGNLYGEMSGDFGGVFEVSPPAAPGGAWRETVLYTFQGPSDGVPYGGLVLDRSGNLYGTTVDGGDSPNCN